MLSTETGVQTKGKKGLLFPGIKKVEKPCKSAHTPSDNGGDSSDKSNSETKNEANNQMFTITPFKKEGSFPNIEVNPFVNLDVDSEDNSPVLKVNIKTGGNLDVKKSLSDNSGLLGRYSTGKTIPIIILVPPTESNGPKSEIAKLLDIEECKEEEIRVVEKENSTESTQDDENNIEGNQP